MNFVRILNMYNKYNIFEENISHNNTIIDNLCIKTTPLIVSPTAYFFYNFAYRTFSSTKVLIIT